MRRLGTAVGLVLVLSLYGVVYGYTLNPTIVTASRIMDKLLNTPAAVEVITSEELKATGTKTLAEALQFVPGVEVYSNGPYGADSWVSIRGVSKELLVMVNGIPVNNPQGESAGFSFNFELIPIKDIQQIEIIKGASSALYGDAAFGGVINIITKKGGKQTKILTKVTKGKDNFYDYFLSASGSQEKFRYFISGGRSSLGEIKEYHRYMPWGETSYKYDDFLGSDKKSVSAQIGYGNWSFYYLYSNVVPEWEANGDLCKQDTKAYLYHLSYSDSLWKFTLYYHKYDKKYLEEGLYPADDHHVNKVKGIDLYRKFVVSDTNLLVLGVNLQKEEIDSTTDGKHDRTLSAVYFEDKFKLGEFVFNIGGRYEKIDQENAKDYTEFLPRISISKSLSKNCRWFLNVGRAFKLPTFDDLYFNSPWTPGNPNLEPEKGWTYEMGFKGLKDNLQYRVSFFYQTLSDYIAWAPTKDNPWIWTPLNVEDFRMKGVELEFKQQVSKNFGWSLGFTFEKAEDKGNPNALDKDKWYRCGIPEFQGKAGLFYQKNGWKLALYYNYIGDRKVEDTFTPYTLGSYSVANLSVEKHFENGWTFSVGATNLFDKRYEIRKNYFSDGRRIYVSASYEF